MSLTDEVKSLERISSLEVDSLAVHILMVQSYEQVMKHWVRNGLQRTLYTGP